MVIVGLQKGKLKHQKYALNANLTIGIKNHRSNTERNAKNNKIKLNINRFVDMIIGSKRVKSTPNQIRGLLSGETARKDLTTIS